MLAADDDGAAHIWEDTRYMDEGVRLRMTVAGGRFATHPFGYIGGNNKGMDELLQFWPRFQRSYNRDSHGTYPFPGIWRKVGPVEATEKIFGEIVPRLHRDDAGNPDPDLPWYELIDNDRYLVYRRDAIILMPDWERLEPLMLAPEEAEGYLYRRSGREAVRHLFRVASSLDSMVVGEAQIQGQVREAYVTAHAMRDRKVVGPVLGRLFETALSVGGRVRAETKLGTGAASVPSAAVELARKIFGSLRGRRALILGAGQMSELALECLAGEGIGDVVVVNRTVRRAEALAGKVGGRGTGFEALPALLREADELEKRAAARQPKRPTPP
mgnify:CR=1 FL=1